MGSVPGGSASITCSGGTGLTVETTSLAVVAWLQARRVMSPDHADASSDRGRLLEAASLGVRWILKQNQGGRFGSTQATVLALKAITEFDAASASDTAGSKFYLYESTGALVAEGVVPGAVDEAQKAGVEPLAPIQLDESALLRAVQHALPSASGRDSGSLVLRGRVQRPSSGADRSAPGSSGDGDILMPWSLKVAFRSRSPRPGVRGASLGGGASKDARFHREADVPELELRTDLAHSMLREGQSTDMRVVVRNKNAIKGAPMTIAVVGVPAGLQAKPSQLQGLVASGKIDAWEQRGREVILYWRSIPAGASEDVRVQLDAAGVGKFTGPPSRAYLYYDEDIVDYADPVGVTIVPDMG